MHEGHKGRLRSKARLMIDEMPDHEVLELLLNYCIVRKNTNHIAHELLKQFKTLSGVLNAPYDLLVNIDGMGEVSATFLTLLPSIYKKIKASESTSIVLDTYLKCTNYVTNHLELSKNEKIFVVCLDKKDRVIVSFDYSTDSIDSVEIRLADLITKVTAAKASKVLVAHNHLTKSSAPSSQDINFTKKVATALSSVGIELVDHIIVSKKDWFSFRNSDIL